MFDFSLSFSKGGVRPYFLYIDFYGFLRTELSYESLISDLKKFDQKKIRS